MAISTDTFDGVDLSRLPPPTVVDGLDYETVRDALLGDIALLMPEFTAINPADPAIKVMEICAFRELLLREEINESSLANKLAFAAGSDLDHIAVRVNLERFIIQSANRMMISARALSAHPKAGPLLGQRRPMSIWQRKPAATCALPRALAPRHAKYW
jgi:phage-related baseplate assembly protein